MKLTVFYDGQLWVGVVEVQDGTSLYARRHVFGPEPCDKEVLLFVLYELLTLTNHLQNAVETLQKRQKANRNPKRIAREATHELRRTGISTRAQEAVKLDYANRKGKLQAVAALKRDELKERKREIARQKAKAKHRGK